MATSAIPIFDPAPEVHMLGHEIRRAIEGVLESGQFILGPNVRAFEDEVAAYLGVKHVVGVNSGTDALVIALRAAGVKPGDEVITTSFTFFATAEAISQVGAKPVFVDIDQESFNLQTDLVCKAITPRTRAVLPVHLYGQPADMAPLLQLAESYGLKVIEDTAQAFGSAYHGKKVGTIGDVGAFSFFPTKNLGACGDAGAIATNDDEIADIARLLRAHGSKIKYHNEEIGYNSRLDEMQAAILRVKLPHLDAFNRGRRRVAALYSQYLSESEGLLVLPEDAHGNHIYHQYTVRICGGQRDEVKEKLRNKGIGTMVYYPVPVHRLAVYRDEAPVLPISEQMAGEVLSLPMWPELEAETVHLVANELKGILRELPRRNGPQRFK